MDGVLLVDKPKGWTSFDVVAKVRGVVQRELRERHAELGTCMAISGAEVPRSAGERAAKSVNRASEPTDKTRDAKTSRAIGFSDGYRCRCKVRVGHTGTLDPSATGLLVLCLGKYTKKVEEMIRHDKTYEVEMTLGATSTTGDQEGKITKSGKRKVVSGEELQKVLDSFIGEQMQTPPAFSAIRVNGKRAYELARAGKEVKLEPRRCSIYDLILTTYDFPIVKFTCSVSSGTYIRSLVQDIGERLSTGAYMSELRRTRVVQYDITNAVDANKLNYEDILRDLITL